VGTPLPSYRQLARKYRTGIQAVRLALKSLAADGQVLIRPRRPPQAALGASLQSTLKKSIALVCTSGLLNSLGSLSGRMLWRGIGEVAQKFGCPLIVLQHDNRWRSEFPAGLDKLSLSGVILIGPFNTRLLRQYEQMKAPVVLVDQPGDEFNLHSVAVDNYNAAFDAASRLIALGHRRIAFVRSLISALRDVDPDSKERQAGFIAACARAGLRETEYKVYSSHHRGTSAMKEIVRGKPHFTAVLCAAPSHAIQAVAAAGDVKKRVPEDISVITFRPSDAMQRDWSGPKIDFESMGRTAANLLLQREARIRHERVATEWNAGDSMSPART
jgi:DNA-binding LacI/PurR family transcriptional regulator